jgi:hypothetical protein
MASSPAEMVVSATALVLEWFELVLEGLRVRLA